MAAETPSQDSSNPPAAGTRHASLPDEVESRLLPSHGVEVDYPPVAASPNARPLPVKYMSAPSYSSPIRHHRRVPSRTNAVKETLNARSHHGSTEDDGAAVHRINQYSIGEEIGRGSFGAVFLATDQYGNEYAVKEFSKSRLRKRAQSNLLRQPNQRRRPGHLAAGLGFNSPLHRILPSDRSLAGARPFDLIKEEIAIMKKLSHHNVVSLFEVLDDPDEDTLYMVLEMCKRGIVMKVGLGDQAKPYTDEECRHWFRDMILGIEYLHAQGIIHRDIKPDNCLVTQDGVLKIVDFGVSEMFEKSSEMSTAKSAGSPAFMPPELCVAKHGTISGRPADIWSMRVTVYCLRYGHIPFEQEGMLELYDSIRQDPVPLDEERDEQFRELMLRLLEKDPEKRIAMPELRAHPWVTRNGTDLLCPEEENCAELVEPPTEAEMNRAITGNMANLMVVMKAVRRFKALVARKRPLIMEGIFGQSSRLVAPPQTLLNNPLSRSTDDFDRKPFERAFVAEGIHRDIQVNEDSQKLPLALNRAQLDSDTSSQEPALSRGTTGDSWPGPLPMTPRASTFPFDDHAKGHAHDPLEDKLYLHIGVGGGEPVDDMIVSESPSGIEDDIYELAYQEEMQRILREKGSTALFLNRRVEHLETLKAQITDVADRSREMAGRSKEAAKVGARHLSSHVSSGGFAGLVKQVQSQVASQVASVADRIDPSREPGIDAYPET